jgi:hypothetical protein
VNHFCIARLFSCGQRSWPLIYIAKVKKFLIMQSMYCGRTIKASFWRFWWLPRSWNNSFKYRSRYKQNIKLFLIDQLSTKFHVYKLVLWLTCNFISIQCAIIIHDSLRAPFHHIWKRDYVNNVNYTKYPNRLFSYNVWMCVLDINLRFFRVNWF